jgi:hypothetical protein
MAYFHSYRRFSTAAIVMVVAAATMCTDAIGSLWHRATDWLTVSVVRAASALPKLVHQWTEPLVHSVALVRARAFVQRLMRREIRFTPGGWRFCHSV